MSTRTAALALTALVALTACSEDATVATPDPTTTPSATSEPAPTPAATTPTPVATTPAPSPGTRAVAVYYLGSTDEGPRLYREFHRRPATTGVVRDAVTAMLDEAPVDDDYESLWPDGTSVRGVRKDGDVLVVDLSMPKRLMLGSGFEAVTIQQLVWTATAADPSAKRVRLAVDGDERESVGGHVDTTRPMARQPLDLGPVWLLTPTEGGTLRRGASFGGEATVFEATVSWQLVQGTRVVAEGFSTASTGAPERGRWSAVADVPPGRYVLRAFESSAEDGRETWVDDKAVTVV